MPKEKFTLACMICFREESQIVRNLSLSKIPLDISKPIVDSKSHTAFQYTNYLYENRFFCTYIRYGRGSPRSDVIINDTTQKIETNPRQIGEIEINNQLFIIYDNKTGQICFSNAKKRSIVQDYYATKFNINSLVIRRETISRNEIIDQIKYLNTITFKGIPDILNYDTSEGQLIRNMFFELPDKFKFELKYQNLECSNKIISALKEKLFKSTHIYNGGFVIGGRDADGYPFIIDKDKITRKVEIFVEINDDDMADPESFFEEFINGLKNGQ